jgi:hypothetical protein
MTGATGEAVGRVALALYTGARVGRAVEIAELVAAAIAELISTAAEETTARVEVGAAATEVGATTVELAAEGAVGAATVELAAEGAAVADGTAPEPSQTATAPPGAV